MKSKLIIFSTISVFSAVVISADAATIAVGRGIGNPGIIASASGVPLATGGYYIATGTFTNGAGVTEVPVITTDFSSLLAAVAAFDVFTSALAPATGTTTGTITGSFASTGGATPTVFNLKPIYFLVGNGTTQANSTAFGIFGLTTSTNFPADVAATVSTSLTLANGTSIVPLNNAGTVTQNSFGLVSSAPIPEPSAALLGAIGALGLLRRRRD